VSRLRRVALFFLIAFITPRVSAAAPPPQPQDDREIQARELFGFGKYAEALALYGRLYAETAHPTYLRNMGRCYQNLGEPDKAINSFREYLRQSKNVSSDQRAVVEGYIREMEELKKGQAAGAAPHASAAVAASPPSAVSPPPVTTTAVTPDLRTDPPVAEVPSGGSRRNAAAVIGGASLIVLGVGGYFGLRAFSNQSDGERLCPQDPCTTGEGLAAYDRAATSALVADVAVGAGLVGAGVAAYLFFTARNQEAKPRAGVAARLRLLPELAPGRHALLVGASW
jgi:tetratricopeptide (TPR) repeat protein